MKFTCCSVWIEIWFSAWFNNSLAEIQNFSFVKLRKKLICHIILLFDQEVIYYLSNSQNTSSRQNNDFKRFFRAQKSLRNSIWRNGNCTRAQSNFEFILKSCHRSFSSGHKYRMNSLLFLSKSNPLIIPYQGITTME